MRPSLALSIGAVFNIVFGLPLLLATAPMLAAFGWAATPNEALVPARDAAVLLLGMGIIDWLARDATGPPLRGLLWGNILTRAAAGAVNSWELAAGILPSAAVGVFPIGLGLNIALIVVFALALRRA